MPDAFNSASRLLEILTVVSRQNGNTVVADVWSNAFSIEQQPGNPKQFLEVAEIVEALFNETLSLEQKMQATNLPSHTYAPTLKRLFNVFNIEMLNSAWNTLSGNLTPEVFTALNIFIYQLPHEEKPMHPMLIQDITRHVKEFSQSIDSNTALTYAARTFLKKQLGIMERGLRKYKVQGSRAFSDAMVDAMVEFVRNEEVVKENEDKDAFATLRKTWITIKEKTADADTAFKVGTALCLGAEALGS